MYDVELFIKFSIFKNPFQFKDIQSSNFVENK